MNAKQLQAKYMRTLAQLKQEQLNEYGYPFCQSCPIVEGYLTPKKQGVAGSHIIPRPRCRNDKEYLYYDKRNIVLQGHGVGDSCECHRLMHSPTMHLLANYEQMIEFTKEHDHEFYQIILQKLKNY